ncbi:MAG: hypothetical protein IPG07_21370 [Crocinitomicaceae bacterium]|nr:hypothetical protein [Crocinitomicaceae bacterium]
MAYNLEAKCYRKSYLITGQTQGIVEDIRRRFPDKDVYWLPNGVNLAITIQRKFIHMAYAPDTASAKTTSYFFMVEFWGTHKVLI